MIHIVFNESEIALMKNVIGLDESLAGEAIQLKDDFAVGPLANIDSEEGWDTRVEWWKELLKNTPYENDPVCIFDDRETVEKIKSKLDADSTELVWIWMGQNQHDVCGYFWLMGQLKEYHGRIYVLYLNNLPFINEKGNIFYPTWLHEIQPREFLKAKRLARVITLSEFEVDPDEWKKLCDENAMVRILEGGKKIVSKEVSYYDADILKAITAEPQKLSKIFHTIYNKIKIKTGDVFLAGRMLALIAEGKLEAIGEWEKGWKEIALKLAADKTAHDESETIQTT